MPYNRLERLSWLSFSPLREKIQTTSKEEGQTAKSLAVEDEFGGVKPLALRLSRGVSPMVVFHDLGFG